MAHTADAAHHLLHPDAPAAAPSFRTAALGFLSSTALTAVVMVLLSGL